MIAYACNPEGGGEHWLGWGWAEQAARTCNVHLITTPNARAPLEQHAQHLGITPHFVAQPSGSRWGRKSPGRNASRATRRNCISAKSSLLLHQTTFHSFRVPFAAAETGGAGGLGTGGGR